MSTTPNDPRFRPFRAAAWAFYLFIAVGYSLLVVYSVVRGVLAMTPAKPPVAISTSVEECSAIARGLFDELEVQRKSLIGAGSAAERQASWMRFRLDWVTRKRAEESKCGVGTAGRERVTQAFAALESLSDAYAVHATQFSQQLSPLVDEFQNAVK